MILQNVHHAGSPSITIHSRLPYFDRSEFEKIQNGVADVEAAVAQAPLLERLFSHIEIGSLPSAIFVASDHLAMAIIRALAQRGVRVPEDISIVGYDDADASAFTFPPITTIRQDLAHVAREAIKLLIRQFEGEKTPEITRLPVSLIERESVRRV